MLTGLLTFSLRIKVNKTIFRSSGGFYTIKDSSDGTIGNHRHHRQLRLSSSRVMATSAPSGTVMMYPNTGREIDSIRTATCTTATATAAAAATAVTPDISLRQRAVAKLRMFNFHLNWDLHMTHCKPCGYGTVVNIKNWYTLIKNNELNMLDVVNLMLNNYILLASIRVFICKYLLRMHSFKILLSNWFMVLFC